MEEFQEADVLWPDRDRDGDEDTEEWHAGLGAHRKASSPVRIPSRPRAVHSWTPGFAYAANCDDDDDDSDDNEGGRKSDTIPPHLIVARRVADKMAFSMCVGIGRTLKGRDLSQVRNSILRMTGFLER
ncbi:protein S40-1-like [Musa acuminata AAA Group]|uniref:protein S40-1-like n=1 Tax=Musa acuminata AAA Group TaxID=214697 RepID=UPI0031D45254